jgi:hypothetical protein
MRIGHARRRVAAGSAIVLAITTASTIITGSSPAFGDTLDVGYTLEGCRPGTFNQNTVTCADGDYTTGNLGKSWSELDLVPVRVTLNNNGNSAETGTFVVAGDYKNGAGTGTGWDVISVLSLDTVHSDAGCPAVTSGAQTITPSGQGVGGADQTIYRKITATIPAHHECIYDYYMRLALGAHNFSGSSLQGNLWSENLTSSGVGEKRVSLPVAEIAPQGLSKTMRAVRDADFVWTLEKRANPVEADFANTCDPTAPRTLPVTITLSWTKSAANPSGYTVTTVVTATNPALRTITVQATDTIYAGATLLDTVVGSALDVPANTSMTVLTHILNITPAQLAALGVADPNNPSFNDTATATYTDKKTGVPVPGTTSASASVANNAIGSGSTSGNSIVVTDSESITPNVGLDFAVAAPSVGSFTGGYSAGTYTTGPVGWTSGSQTSSGSVTFNKTVRVAAAVATTGVLSDTATGTFGSNTTTASASTTLTSSPLVALTINKRRSPVTSEAQTFDFVVKDSSNATIASPSITVPGGTPASTDTSTTLNGLDPGTYTVDETATGPYAAQHGSATISLPSCSGSVSFNNVAAPARARVRKVTVPDSGTIWSFTLTGPDVGVNGTETVNATAGAGYVNFTSSLDTDGAVYTITEDAVLPNYDPTGVVGDFTTSSATRAASTSLTNRTCSFTLDQPTDSGGVLSCTFTNTQRGALKVHKTVIRNDSGNTLTDTFTICITGLSYPAPTLQNGGCQTTGIGGGDLTWTNLLPGTYTVSEAPPGTPWIVGIDPVSVNVAPGSTASAVASTVTNTRKGRVRVIKTVSSHDGSNQQPPSGTESFAFQLRSGTTDILGNPGTLLETGTANAGNNGQFTFTTLLTPGQHYQVCETLPDPAWMIELGPGPQFVPEQWTDATRQVLNPNVVNDTYCVDFIAQPGPDPTVITANNRRPPEGFALTIGYWKNHASCSSSKGGQDFTLDEVLASFPIAAGQTTHGVYIGDVYVDTCLEAVRLLNKSTINTNKKFASDPLFNLAAQLLAAKLNYQAGAGTCGSATTAINAGQALLDQYNFTGTATVKLKSSQVAGANSIAHTLDLYNNNLLC